LETEWLNKVCDELDCSANCEEEYETRKEPLKEKVQLTVSLHENS